MPTSEASRGVSENGERWDFACPRCPFTSSGHDTKKAATARGQEHLDEHDSVEGGR